MSGFGVKLDDRGFDQAITAIAGIEKLDRHRVLDGIGRIIQESTRERIEETKTSPEGATWAKNRAGSSTLYDSGNLSASIDYAVSGSQVQVGSALVYSAIHQFGGTIKPKSKKRLVFMAGNSLVFATSVTIPARPYVGISTEDHEDIVDAVKNAIAERLQ